MVGRQSPRTLYSQAFATFEKDTVYNQRDAEGFIRLNALRLRIGALATELESGRLAERRGLTRRARPRNDCLRRLRAGWRRRRR